MGLSLEIDFCKEAEHSVQGFCGWGVGRGLNWIATRNPNRTVFLACHNYISIMQMSLVLVVKGLLECVIENAKDCLASKCRGNRWLVANQNGFPRATRAESLPQSLHN